MERRFANDRQGERGRPDDVDNPALDAVAQAYGLSRRAFLRQFGTGILAVSAGGALVGCSGADDPTATVTEGATTSTTVAPAIGTPTQQAQAGGVVQVDIETDPLSLDAVRYNGTDIQRVYRLVNQSLLLWTEDRELAPLLADLPEISDDRLTYTFTLKEGIQFHSGKTLEAEDVRFTYQTILDSEVALWRSSISLIDSVEAPDPQTVVFTLSQVFVPMLGKFGLIPIVPSDVEYVDGETYARSPVGTGPFAFVSWDQGQQIVLERFEDYWEDGQPQLDGVTFRIVGEVATRSADLLNGEAQLLPAPPPSQVELLQDRGATVTVAENSTGRYMVYPNLQEGRPTADVNLRKAIAWALDRGQVVDQVFAGAAVPASTYLSSGSLYFDEELGTAFGSEPDLDKAREFLEMAGGPPTDPLLYLVDSTQAVVDVATIVQSSLAAIDIEVNLSPEEIASWFPKFLAQEYDLVSFNVFAQSTSGFGPDYPFLGYSTGSPTNFNGFSDPKMDELLITAVSVPEGEEAQQAWRAVQEYDLETLGQIQVVTARYIEGVGDALVDYEPSSLGWLHRLSGAQLQA